MGESLLVRKSGGGGFDINGVERTYTIATGTNITGTPTTQTYKVKKGDFVDKITNNYSTSSPVVVEEDRTFNLTFKSSQWIKIDEQRVLMFVGGDPFRIYLFKRNENNVFTKTLVYSGVSGESVINNQGRVSGVHLSEGVFVVSYLVSVNSNWRNRITTFRLNSDDTITLGTTNDYDAGSIAFSNVIGRVDQNVFVASILLNSQVRNVASRVNLTDLTWFGTTNTILNNSSYLFISSDGIEGLSASNIINKAAGTNSIYYGYFTYQNPSKQVGFCNITVNLDTLNTGFSFITLQGMLTSDYTAPTITYLHGTNKLIVFPQPTSGNIASTYFPSQTASTNNTTVENLSGNHRFSKVLKLNNNRLFMMYTDTTTRKFRIIETAHSSTNVLNYSRVIASNSSFFTANFINLEFGIVAFNDGTILYAGSEVANSDYRLVYRVLTPTNQIIAVDLNDAQYQTAAPFGIALEDGVSGQTIKVLTF
jgi:hypothetical protein